MISILIVIFCAGLCWGSFLNAVAYRILHHKNFFHHRSVCPSCNHTIYWFDNIPLISWLILQGKCRWCQSPISLLYPFIELTTAILIVGMFMKAIQDSTPDAWPLACYLTFFSALICASRTDLEAMVIPQCFSLWLVPLGWACSLGGLINILFAESILSAFLGYGILWLVARGFKWLTEKDGMGEGDMELLALIGSFMGVQALWISLMSASFIGIIVGGLYLLHSQITTSARIPFGPFLALGAVIYYFFGNVINAFLFCT